MEDKIIYFTYTPLYFLSNYVDKTSLSDLTLDIVYFKDYNIALGSCSSYRSLLTIKPLLIHIIDEDLAQSLIEHYVNGYNADSDYSKKATEYLEQVMNELKQTYIYQK